MSTAAKQLLNFCAEKGTRILLLNWTFSENWLRHPQIARLLPLKLKIFISNGDTIGYFGT